VKLFLADYLFSVSSGLGQSKVSETRPILTKHCALCFVISIHHLLLPSQLSLPHQLPLPFHMQILLPLPLPLPLPPLLSLPLPLPLLSDSLPNQFLLSLPQPLT
jgi:hypothetical protein